MSTRDSAFGFHEINGLLVGVREFVRIFGDGKGACEGGILAKAGLTDAPTLVSLPGQIEALLGQAGWGLDLARRLVERRAFRQ